MEEVESPSRRRTNRRRRRGVGAVISSLGKSVFLDPTRRCDGHDLVQDQEFQLQFQDVAEGLDGMADAGLVEVDQDDGQDVQADGDDDDVDEIDHDAALSDARLEVQELG